MVEAPLFTPLSVYAPFGLSAQSTGELTTEANGKLGREDFLLLLVASMRGQDPLNPVDNGEMIAQMAQFSMLESMLNLTEGFVALHAMAMLGKTVKATAVDGSIIEGTVLTINTNKGEPIITLEDGSVVSLKDIYEVAN